MSYDDDEMRSRDIQDRMRQDYQMRAMQAQAAQMNNAYNQQGLGNWAQGQLGQSNPPVKTVESLKRSWEDAQMRADSLRSEYERALYKEPVKGPSMEQMVRFPALKEAWDSLRTIMKLTGVEN